MAKNLKSFTKKYEELDNWELPLDNEEYNLTIDCRNISQEDLLGNFPSNTSSSLGNKLKALPNKKYINLKFLNIPKGIKSTSYMLFGCTNIKSIDTSAFKGVINAQGMFACCSSLCQVNTKGLLLVENAEDMFIDCKSLANIDTSNFSNVKVARNMFEGCSGLKSINTSFFTQVTDATGMFFGCKRLSSIDTSVFKNIILAENMFANCINLENIDISFFKNVETIENIFYWCSSLTTINWGNIKPKIIDGAFSETDMLQYIKVENQNIKNWLLSQLKNTKAVFYILKI